MLDTFHLTLEFAPVEEADDPYARRTGTQDYLLRSGSGDYTSVALRWNQALFDDLDALRAPNRDPALVQAMGERLRRFVAPSGWQQTLATAAEASAEGHTVILTIRSSAAELYQLPWELLTLQSGQHLGALEHVLFRYELPRSKTTPRVPSGEGGRIALAWSAAGGRVPSGRHQQLIADACRRGNWRFDPATDVAAHLTISTLSELVAQPDVAVLHLLAHGTEAGASAHGLAVDAPDGGVHVLDPGRLRDIFAPQAGHLRLVVICACDSGNVGAAGNRLGSVAQALHEAGIAAIVASRFPLSVDGAGLLTEALYDSLLGGPTSVETALLKARRRLLAESATLDWASIQLYARGEDGHDSRPVTMRPFRGLLAYQPPDARFFFGRDAERTELLSDLEELRASGRPRFLVVAGASGTGKSSMVLAGAVPDLLGHHEAAYHRDESVQVEQIIESLRRLLPTYDPPAVRQSLDLLVQLSPGAKSSVSGWRYLVFRPGAHPLEALDETMGDLNVQQGPVLLIVDQFEEIFTQCESPAERETFAQRLWSFARLADAKTHVIITIRVDYLGQCGELVIDEAGTRLDRIAYDEAHRVFVAQMGPRQMRAAIEEPAHKVGLELEAGLVDRMLSDVEGEPGALPLLSYTLDLLWQSRDGRVLTQAAYDAVGGVAGALHGRADAIIEALNEVERHQARRLLVRLVAVEDGAWDARRRVRIAEVRPALLWHVPFFEIALAALVDARLLVQGQEGRHATIELAHEALIRRWTRLRDWIVADQHMLAQVKTVERWAEEWRRFRRLLVDDQLGYALKVREDFGEELSEDARTLVQESQDAVRRAATRRRRMSLGFMGFAVVTALSMLGLAIWGLTQKGEADRSAIEAFDQARSARIERDRATNANRVSVARGQEYREPLLASLFLLEFAGRNGADAIDDPESLDEEDPPAGGLSLARRLASKPVPIRRLDSAQVLNAESETVLRFARSGEVFSAVNGIARVHRPTGSRRLKCHGEAGFSVERAAFTPDGQTADSQGLPAALLERRSRDGLVERRLCALGTEGAGTALPINAGLPRPARISIDRSGRTVAAIWTTLSCARASVVATPVESVGATLGYARRVAAAVQGDDQGECALVGRWAVDTGESAFLQIAEPVVDFDIDPSGARLVIQRAGGAVEQIDLARIDPRAADARGARPDWRVELHNLAEGRLTDLRYAADGHRVIGETGRAVLIWGEELATAADGQPAQTPHLLDHVALPTTVRAKDGTQVVDFQIRAGTMAWRLKGGGLVVQRDHAPHPQSFANVAQIVLLDGRRPRLALHRPGTHWQFIDAELPEIRERADGPLLVANDFRVTAGGDDEEDGADGGGDRAKRRRPAQEKADADLPAWTTPTALADQRLVQAEVAPVEAPAPAQRAVVTVEACARGVQSTQVEPRGRYLLVITEREVCLLPTGPDGRVQRIPVAGVVAASFRADGRYVALLGADGASAIWPVDTEAPRQLTTTQSVERIWFPANDLEPPVLYGLDQRSTLHRWRMDTEALAQPEPLEPIPHVVQVAKSGQWAVAGTQGRAHLIDLFSDSRLELEGLEPDRKQVEFSDSGKRITQISQDGVRLWTAPDGIRSLLASKAPIKQVEISPNDARAVTVTDRQLTLWNLTEMLAIDRVTVDAGTTARFTIDGEHILLGGPTKLTRLDVGQLQERFHFEVPPDVILGTPKVSPDNRFVVAQAVHGRLTDRLLAWRLDGKDGGKPRIIRGENAVDGYEIEGWSFAARILDGGGARIADRPHVLIRSNIGAIERRRLDRFGLDGTMLGHAEVVEDLVYHPAGRMVTRDRNDEVRLWLARDSSGAAGFLTGQFDSQVIDDGTAQVERAVFGPEGEWLVTQTRYGTLWAWRLGWESLMTHLRARTDACLTAGERVRYLGGRWDQAQAEASACPPWRAR